MKQKNENIFERPQKQASFVGKLAVRTKSKIRNFQPYKTISKLFVSPDTGTWKRFGQGGSDVKARDVETGFDITIDVSDQESSSKEEEFTTSSQRRLSYPLREKMNFSRIILPMHYHFRKSKQDAPSSENLQSVTNLSSGIDEKQCKEEIQLVSHKAKRSSECSLSDGTGGFSEAYHGRRESVWKSFFEAFEVDDSRSAQGFWHDWKSGMKNYWQIFTGETTAHGYKRTMAPHRTLLGRMFWMLAIIGVTSSVVALLYNTMYGQDLYAFSSSIKSQPNVQMAFPAVTVCNLASYDYRRLENTPLKNYSHSVREFLLQVSGLKESINNTEGLGVLKDYDTKVLHDLIGWRLEDFIRNCYWNEVEMNCSEIFVQSKTLTETCFTFNFDPNNLTLADRVGSVSGLGLLLDVGDGKEAFKLRVASGLKVLLHEPQEFPNARENGILISPGTTTYMSVAKNEYKFLPRPYKAYGTEFCSDSTSQMKVEVGNKVSYYNYTGHSSCVAECRLKAILDTCGCVVYAKDPDIPGVPYCTADNYVNCYIPTLRDSYMQSPFHMANCSCPLPCQKVEYSTQMSSAAFPRTTEGVLFLDKHYLSNSSQRDSDIMQNYVELKIFYKELFSHIEEHVPLYTWLTIFGNVGGQMGLFTGASVLTVVEFLELFLVIIWLLLQAGYIHFRTKWRSDSKRLNEPWKSESGLP